jgi:hypothetical protein
MFGFCRLFEAFRIGNFEMFCREFSAVLSPLNNAQPSVENGNEEKVALFPTLRYI